MTSDNIRTLLLEEMTWPEIKAAIQSGMRTVVVGVGATEQHGPHLPLLTDTQNAADRAVRIAKKLGHALVAPVIRPGCSDHHLSFAGTISLREETLIAIVEDYCSSLQRHGFETCVLFSAHGGNYSALEKAVARVRMNVLGMTIILPTDRTAYLEKINEISRQCGIEPERGGLHAGQLETASMLCRRPELVKMEHACEGWIGTKLPADLLKQGLEKLSPVGILGDPRQATAEQGAMYEAGLVEFLVERVRKMLDTGEDGDT